MCTSLRGAHINDRRTIPEGILARFVCDGKIDDLFFTEGLASNCDRGFDGGLDVSASYQQPPRELGGAVECAIICARSPPDNCTNVHYPTIMSKPNPPKTPGGARKRKPKRFATVEAGPDRDQAVLDMIAGSLREQGRPPTIREIGEAFGIASTNGVRYYLDRLEKAGKIRRDRWTSRGIELSGPKPASAAAPKAPVIAIPQRPLPDRGA